MVHSKLKSIRFFSLMLLLLAMLTLTACGSAEQNKTYTIGIVNYDPPLNIVLDGLKEGMTELGYLEGENITYVYQGPIANDPAVIDAEIQRLLEQNVDLLFTMGNPTTLAAKAAVEGTDTPVVFCPTINPVGAGIVESISQPGGNVTGVQRGFTVDKSLEWLLKLAPDAKKVYVPYNPDDIISTIAVASLPEATAQLGIELIPSETYTPEEMVATVENLSKDTVVFLVPVPTLDPGIQDMFEAAAEHDIIVGSFYLSSHVETGALVFYGSEFPAMGKQAARLVDQIFRGTKPADLPVETDESFLYINLKRAETLGLDIPDDILRQADNVIR
ncbi:MAG: ABC transporter substrate-binding protein [Anaerolineae bacterium]|nr:ABC transporter substrate-binding protein [Anaerolineae bacterium]